MTPPLPTALLAAMALATSCATADAAPVRPPVGSPSGVAMPSGDLDDWRQVFRDDFTGRDLDATKWGVYSGRPGSGSGGYWAPSHVTVGNGKLVLRTYRDPRFGGRWVSGGLSSARGLKQTYGRYLLRFRMEAGKGIGYAALLWPVADHWPPEVDFAEEAGGSRDHTTATVHYGRGDSVVHHKVRVDVTRWHTLGVDWTAGRLTFTLDGRLWASVTSHVPAERMELDLQTQACLSVCPGAGTPREVDMEVDWVVAYAPRN